MPVNQKNEKSGLLPSASSTTSPTLSHINSTRSHENQKISGHSIFNYWFVSLGIVYTIIVCGLATVAIGALIQDLAANVGRTSTDIGTVYVARGVGGIIGSFMSFPLFEHYNAVRSLMILHVVTFIAMMWLPVITDVVSLHIAYFVVGLVTAVIQAGSMVLLRKYHKEKAGPWLGAFGAAFCSAGLLVPAVQLVVPSFHYQFYVFSGIVFIGLIWLLLLPHIAEDIHDHHYHAHLVDKEEIEMAVREGKGQLERQLSVKQMVQRVEAGEINGNASEKSNNFDVRSHSYASVEGTDLNFEWVEDEEAPQPEEGKHYYVELVIATMIFFLIGGGDTVTFYLETYVDMTGVTDSESKAELLLIFFLFSLVGDILGIIGQIGVSDRGLSLQLLGMFTVGTIAMASVVLFPNSENVLWYGVAALGLSNAPSISYSFGLNNRLTSPTASSTAIIILGLNLGVSLIPYVTSLLWNWYDQPLYLPLSALICTAIAIPLLFIAPKLSYAQRPADSPAFITF